MKSAQQKCFQIADDKMHQRQPVGDLFGRCNFGVMFMAFGNHPQAADGIGSKLAPANLFEQPFVGLLSGEFSGSFEMTDFVLFHVSV